MSRAHRLVTLAIVCAASSARAQEPATVEQQLAAMQSQLDELHAQQAALQARLAASEARAAASEARAAADGHARHTVSFTAAPGKGLTLVVGELFQLSLRSRVQIRESIHVGPGEPVTNEIAVRTLRLWLQGFMGTRDLQYAFQLAFGGNDPDAEVPNPVLDAWIDYVRVRDLKIRVGQFFVPFDRARTTLELGMQLPDRGQVVNELSLDRDVGVQLSSTDLFGARGVLGYSLGVFGGEGKNRFGGAGVGFLYVGRFVVTPFGPFDDNVEGDLSRQRRPRLAIGVAGAYNQSTNRSRSTTGKPYTLGTFDYGHAAADLVFKIAGFSVLAEVLYRQARQGSLVADVGGVTTREWSRSAIGWLVQVGAMVHDRVELVARYDELRAIGQTDPALVAMVATSGRELNAGLNVFVYGHAFKVQTDYQYLFGDSIRNGRHGWHLQLEASF